MALKTICKFWRSTSAKGSAYYSFKSPRDIKAGERVMLFRRDSSDDDSAGNVCVAVDDDQPRHSPDNPFAGGKHRNQGGQHRASTTATDRRYQAEQPAVDNARETRELKLEPGAHSPF